MHFEMSLVKSKAFYFFPLSFFPFYSVSLKKMLMILIDELQAPFDEIVAS